PIGVLDTLSPVAPADLAAAAAAPRLTYLVKRLELAVRAGLDAVTSARGLTTPQYAALSVLRLRPGTSSAALARMSFVSAQSMGEMVSTLEGKDLIRREPDPNHRKMLRLFLTGRGETLLAACDAQVDEVEARMLARLDPPQVLAFADARRLCTEGLVGE
ncbi:MAG: MarR family winged helix-turn-helix transcriptional regulator, partial [Trebonia sp.]